MKKKSKPDYSKLKLGFSEMKGYFLYLSEANDALDNKLIALISTMGFILTFFVSFGFDYNELIPCYIFVLLSLLVISFLFFVSFIFKGLFPKNVPYPFDGTYEGIQSNFEQKSNLHEVYDLMIVNYEKNLELLKIINLKKSRNLKNAFYFYIITLVLILLIIFIPLI